MISFYKNKKKFTYNWGNNILYTFFLYSRDYTHMTLYLYYTNVWNDLRKKKIFFLYKGMFTLYF